MEIFLVCLQIFGCRILDVSLATVRTILTVRGRNVLAGAVGFVEVFIWFLIVREALGSGSGGIWVALSYAGGFAAGTYIGGLLASKFLGGIINMQIITSRRDDALIEAIRAGGFAVTVLNVNRSGYGEEKYLLMLELKSERRKRLERIVQAHDPDAFVMIRETKYIQNGFIK